MINATIITTIKNIFLRHGLTPPEESKIIPDGRFRRWDEDGKKNGKGNLFLAVYSLSPLHLTGGDWRDKNTWFSHSGDEGDSPLSEEQRREIEEQKKQQRDEDEKDRQRSLMYLQKYSSLPTYDSRHFSTPHPYLRKKGLSRGHIARWDSNGNYLVFPLYDKDGRVANVQKISVDGDKRFLKKLPREGLFCPLWNDTSDTSRPFVVEGFATGLSVLEATDRLTIVALCCENLSGAIRTATKYLLQAWKLTERPESFFSRFIILADNDISGAGEEGARTASRELGCSYAVIPNFGNAKITDANDFASVYGIEALNKLLIF